MKFNRTCFIVGLGCLCALLLVRPAFAGPEKAELRGVYAAAADVPADAEFLVVVQDAAVLRRGPAGESLHAIVQNILAGTQTAQAWAEFSRELLIDETGVFDRILGKSFAYVRRPEPQGSSWLLLTDVSPSTDSLLRKRLAPAPRKLLGGRPLLSVENGKFWLTTAVPPKQSSRVVLALSESARPELLEEVGANLGQPLKKSLADHPDIQQIRQLDPQAQALLVIRTPENGGLFAMTARIEGPQIRLMFMLRPQAGVNFQRVPLWSLDIFDRLKSDSLVAFVQAIPGDRHPFDWIDRIFLINNQPVRHLQNLQPVGALSALVVSRAENAPFSVALAIDTPSVTDMAMTGDQCVAQLLAEVTQAAPTDLAQLDHRGIFPTALRVAPLSFPAGSLAASLIGTEPSLAWVSSTQPDNGDHGWWTIGFGKQSVLTLAAAVAQTAQKQQQTPNRWVSVGAIRPRDLMENLDNQAPIVAQTLGTYARPGRLIESIEWSAVATEIDLIIGWGEVVVSPAPGEIRERPRRPANVRRGTGRTR